MPRDIHLLTDWEPGFKLKAVSSRPMFKAGTGPGDSLLMNRRRHEW